MIRRDPGIWTNYATCVGTLDCWNTADAFILKLAKGIVPRGLEVLSKVRQVAIKFYMRWEKF